MAFWGNLKKKAGTLAQSAAQKSGEVMEITKLNMNIKTEKEAKEALYRELGEFYFKKQTTGEFSEEIVNKLCEQIKIHAENIVFYQEKVNKIKNMIICPICGQGVERDNQFCGKCGAEIGKKREEE